MQSTFLSAAWQKLIMANYEVPQQLLDPFLPAGTEHDLCHGKCYVSLVAFLFTDIRLKGWRIPWHTSFEEINLRFYVRHTDSSGASHRGVVFLQELVPRAAVTLVANTLYGEAYRTRPTKHTWRHTEHSLEIEYRWRWSRSRKHTLKIPSASTWSRIAVRASPVLHSIVSDSIEEFITEHYWGFTRRTVDQTSGYEVVHPRWQIYPIQSYRIDLDFAAQYGSAFAHLQTQIPASILLAEGSPIAIRSGAPLQIGRQAF